MTPDIKAIRAAVDASAAAGHISCASSATVLALCDEVDMLLNGMYNIANQSTEPAIQEFARSYLESNT